MTTAIEYIEREWLDPEHEADGLIPLDDTLWIRLMPDYRELVGGTSTF